MFCSFTRERYTNGYYLLSTTKWQKMWEFLLQKLPPQIPSTIPFLGHAISFGAAPTEFLLAAYEKVLLCCLGLNVEYC